MKKLMLFFCAALLSVSLVLSGALAEAVPVEFTVKGARYDMTEDEFAAWGEQAFHVGDWWDGSRLLADYPLLTEAVMKLYDEVRNNSSTLEQGEYYVSWHTDALKIAFDERMMGVRVWVEFGSEEQARSWDPAACGLGEYLADDVTEKPGQSMSAYWTRTRLPK